MNKKRNNIGGPIEALMVIAGLLAIILSSSLLIVVTAPDPDNQEEHTAIANIIFPDATGSMEKNEPFSPGKSSILAIPAVVVIQNYENLRPESRVIEYKSIQQSDDSRFDNLTTTASISPEKALEFTLVGAKPSGTS